MSKAVNGVPSVGRICAGRLVTADVNDSILEAAQKMTYERVGALVVMDKGTLVGIISEADLVGAMVDEAPLESTPIRDYMTEAPITVAVSDDPSLAARYMVEHEIGHLPVMDLEEPVGMLSKGDLLAVGGAIAARTP